MVPYRNHTAFGVKDSILRRKDGRIGWKQGSGLRIQGRRPIDALHARARPKMRRFDKDLGAWYNILSYHRACNEPARHTIYNEGALTLRTISPKRMTATAMLLMKAIITAVVLGAFLYLVLNYYPETDFHFKGYLVFVFLYVCIYFAFVSTYRAYRFGILRYREIMFAYLLSTFMTNFFMYFVLSLSAKMLLPLEPISVMMAAQWGAGLLLNLLADRLYYLVHPVRDCIVVSSEGRAELKTLKKFHSIQKRYRILDELDETAGFDAIVDRIRPYSTVILGNVSTELRLELTEHCFEHNQRLFFVPNVQDIIMHNSQETFVGDSLLYLCKNRTFTTEQLVVKRLMDIVISAVGIVITSPIMLIVALLIKTWDGGPVLFRQTRYTRNLTPFTLVKFRSMIVDAEKDGAQFTVPHDKRITPVGKFIRATRFDELPQLFNIIHGEMSLVGPRAERIENADFYCELMPEFRYRMKVKAGLTGYAQIYGKYNTSYEDKLKMDLLYIENCSIVKDLQLLFLTLKVIFMPESTEGYEHEHLEDLPGFDEPEPMNQQKGN